MYRLFSSKKTALTSGKVLTKNFSKTISFEFTAGLIFIQLFLNKKTYKLLLDTAAFTLLSSELIEELSCSKSEEYIEIFDAFGSTKDLQLYKLPSLNISGLLFTNFNVVCDDFSHRFPLSCLKFDGILGYNLFKNLILEIDYERQEILLSDQLRKTDAFLSSKLTRLQGGNLGFTLQIQKQNFMLAIDTGKNDGLMLGEKVFLEYCLKEKLKRQRTVGLFSSSFSGLNQHSFIDTFLLKDFTINKKITINSHPVSYQKNAQNIAGNAFLKHYHIILDFRKKRLYLKQKTLNIEEDFYKDFGFLSFWNTEKKLFISAIIQDSPAYKSKLKIGDKIMSINDLDTLHFSKEQYCKYSLLTKNSMFYDKQTTLLTIIVKRGKKLIREKLYL